MRDDDILISFAVQLAPAYAGSGLAPRAIVVVYDNKHCNAIVGCLYQDHHYHIPYRCPDGQQASAVAKNLRDDPAWSDSFLNDQLQKLLNASPVELAFMEVPGDEVRIN